MPANLNWKLKDIETGAIACMPGAARAFVP